jgi:hypothetical protein
VRHLAQLAIVLALGIPFPCAAQTASGWTDLAQFLVPSDGTRSLGDFDLLFNDTRDLGSKIAYFNVATGNNDTAEVYWWDGAQIIDSAGSATSPANGQAYGTDPLHPNEEAIKPFAVSAGMRGNSEGDPRLRTHKYDYDAVAGGYPDWLLYRRGQTHVAFDGSITGGRSESEPLVIAAYGPLADGRAVIDPDVGGTVVFQGEARPIVTPFDAHNSGDPQSWIHEVFVSLELRLHYGHLNGHVADSYSGGPVTAFFEDCIWPTLNGGLVVYPPKKTTFRRSILARSWLAEAHNQAYYTSDFENEVTFDEVIFYKNGYKTNPLTDPDPRRDIFSRNVYEGGGAQMGHTYRNVISADGASGGPQMRLGGRIENSLIIEGYWFSSTNSNNLVNEWLTAGHQTGQSAEVRNNVQLVFRYPSPRDPDTTGASDTRAQPGAGYTLQGASFGALVEGNIVSGAMREDDLGHGRSGNGLEIVLASETYEDGVAYNQRNNVLRDNIVYRMGGGLSISGDAQGALGLVIENNVFHADGTLSAGAASQTSPSQVVIQGNRFYSASGSLPGGPWMGTGNTLGALASAASSEGWSDPDRTLRRYVLEVLGLDLLDWTDDPFVDPTLAQLRIDAGETYDPMGLKTFMAVATRMRRGGRDAIPTSGKPDMNGDYPWDRRFTAAAVVDWIRAGFGLAPVETSLRIDDASVVEEDDGSRAMTFSVTLGEQRGE